MAATVTFGVAPLLFVQLLYPRLIYAAAIVNGWYWLLIVLAAIVAYYCLYAAASRSRRAGGGGVWLWIALLGMLYISFVYSAVFTLAESPGRMLSLYAADPTGATLELQLGSYGLRWLHMVLGALAVGSFVVGLVVRDDAAAAGSARRLFLVGMVLAMGGGLAYLLTLGDLLRPFMRSPGIWYLTAGIVLALGALHLAFTRRLVLAGAALGLSMLGMVAARHALRLVALDGVTDAGASHVEPQWVVFGIFLVCFLLAIGVIAWMLRVFLARPPEPV
jgi:hypothetical protein